MPLLRCSTREVNILRRHFEAEGAQGCMARMKKLERRGLAAVKYKARKLGLKGPRPHNALIHLLSPVEVEEVIRLHDEEHLGFAPIGARFGVCESTASNAYYAVMCRRRGYRPAERDERGALLPAEIERLRTFLRKGARGVDIQLYMAISAATISHERRQYAAELRARGKRPLPPPGNGARYSGARIAKGARREVERLYLAGKATPKVSQITGVSLTQCVRIRAKIVKRLKRKGQCLPGCDINGARRTYPDTILRIPEEKKAELRRLILDRVPVTRAAKLCGIGSKSAYEIRDALRIELEARGEWLPDPIRLGNGTEARRLKAEAEWLPRGRRAIIRYRQLLALHGDAEAQRIIKAEMAEAEAARRAALEQERQRPLTFEEQLERVRAGAAITTRFEPRRREPDFTLGGIATAQL